MPKTNEDQEDLLTELLDGLAELREEHDVQGILDCAETVEALTDLQANLRDLSDTARKLATAADQLAKKISKKAS